MAIKNSLVCNTINFLLRNMIKKKYEVSVVSNVYTIVFDSQD